jgi:hypothetical protein
MLNYLYDLFGFNSNIKYNDDDDCKINLSWEIIEDNNNVIIDKKIVDASNFIKKENVVKNNYKYIDTNKYHNKHVKKYNNINHHLKQPKKIC